MHLAGKQGAAAKSNSKWMTAAADDEHGENSRARALHRHKYVVL